MISIYLGRACNILKSGRLIPCGLIPCLSPAGSEAMLCELCLLHVARSSCLAAQADIRRRLRQLAFGDLNALIQLLEPFYYMYSSESHPAFHTWTGLRPSPVANKSF
jgi:hypothetical protein